VSKLSDTRIINGELENLVFGPRKEFISMAVLVVMNIIQQIRLAQALLFFWFLYGFFAIASASLEKLLILVYNPICEISISGRLER
jgi:hypothetical protein